MSRLAALRQGLRQMFRTWRWGNALSQSLLRFSLVFLLPLGSAAWILTTPLGTSSTLKAAAYFSGGIVQIDEPSGRLWDNWGLRRFRLKLDSVQVDIHDLKLHWHLPDFLTGKLKAADIRADRVLVLVKPSNEPTTIPKSIGIPLGVEVLNAQLGELTVGEMGEPGKDEMALLYFHARTLALREFRLKDGRWHVAQAQANTDWGLAQVQGDIGVKTPFPLAVKLSLDGEFDVRKMGFDGELSGSLLALKANVRGRSIAGLGGLNGEASLDLRPFELIPVYSANIALGGIDPAAFDRRAPQADLSLNLQLTPSLPEEGKGKADKDALDLSKLRVVGPLSIHNKRPAAFDRNGIAVERLSANLEWGHGVLKIADVDVNFPKNGRAKGSMSWHQESREPLGKLEAKLTLSNVAVESLVEAMRPLRVDGYVQAGVTETVQSFEAKLKTPEGTVDVLGRVADNSVILDKLNAKVRGLDLQASGHLQLAGKQVFKANGNLRGLNPQRWSVSAPLGMVNAQFDLTGALSPSWQVQGSLNLAESQFAGYPLGGSFSGALAPDGVKNALLNLSVLGNQFNAQGSFGQLGDQLSLSLRAPKIDKLLKGYSGDLSADGVVHGTLDAPGLNLTAALTDLRLPGGQSMAKATAALSLAPGAQGALNINAKINDFKLGEAKPLQMKDFSFVVKGTRPAHEVSINTLMADGQVLNAHANGAWLGRERLNIDGVTWRGKLDALNAANGQLGFKLSKPVSLAASSKHFELGEAELRTSNGSILMQRTLWTPDRIEARGKMTGLRVGLQLDDMQRTVMRGRSLQLGAEWDLVFGAVANGTARMFREDGDIVLQGDAPVALGLKTFELILAATDNRLALAATAVGDKVGVISGSATALAERNGSDVGIAMHAPLLGAAHVEISDISWIGPLINQNFSTGGKLLGDFSLSGTPAKPIGAGSITGSALVFAMADQGMSLVAGDLDFRFDAEKLRIQKLKFLSNYNSLPKDPRVQATALTKTPGSLALEGELILATGKGRLDLTLDRVGVMQRQDVWILLSGKGEVLSTWNDAAIKADFRSDAAFVGFAKIGAPSLSDDVVVKGDQVSKGRHLVLSADATLDFGDKFLIKAYGVDTLVGGKLRVQRSGSGTGVLHSSGVLTTRDGRYDAYSQRLVIERGILNFNGPLDNPGLNIEAVRKGLAVEAGVAVTGTAQKPQIRLIADVGIPDSEKLSWLFLGRGGEVDARDTGLLLSAAGAILGGGEGVTDRIAHSLGLDKISLAQSDASTSRAINSRVASAATGTSAGLANEETGEQVLTAGKRLSRDAYVSVEQNFVGTETLLKFTYSLTRYLSLIVRAGSDNALDLNYSISFK